MIVYVMRNLYARTLCLNPYTNITSWNIIIFYNQLFPELIWMPSKIYGMLKKHFWDEIFFLISIWRDYFINISIWIIYNKPKEVVLKMLYLSNWRTSDLIGHAFSPPSNKGWSLVWSSRENHSRQILWPQSCAVKTLWAIFRLTCKTRNIKYGWTK